jgi:hypothetical protein
MLLYICRYFCIVVGFAIIVMMLYTAFADLENFQPLNAIEYSVPAIIFIGIAYRSFPKDSKKTPPAKKRQLNS